MNSNFKNVPYYPHKNHLFSYEIYSLIKLILNGSGLGKINYKISSIDSFSNNRSNYFYTTKQIYTHNNTDECNNNRELYSPFVDELTTVENSVLGILISVRLSQGLTNVTYFPSKPFIEYS